MSNPRTPLATIVPPAPAPDRRPTIVRPVGRDRDGIFRGWGPKI